MTDLDLRFDPGAIGDAVRQPPLADLRHRATVRRRRRHTAAGAALTAVLAAAGVPMLTGGGGGPVADPVPGPQVAAPGWASAVWVGEGGSAVAVRERGEDCVPLVRVTRDAGRTWSPPRPAAEPDCDLPTTTGRATLRFEVLDTDVFVLTVDDRDRRLSVDGGRTWSELLGAVEEVDAFPPRARAAHCGGCATNIRPLAVDHDTRTVYKLRHDLPVFWLPHEVHEAADGSLWAITIGLPEPGQPGPGPEVLIRSADRGRTWATEPLPGGWGTAVAPRDGGQAYLLGQGPTDVAGTLHRTVDGGATWEPVPTDLTVTATTGLLVRPDGGLVAATAGDDGVRVLVSDDGGRHFAPTAHFAATPAPATAADGRITVLTDAAVEVTTDGETWETLPVPAG